MKYVKTVEYVFRKTAGTLMKNKMGNTTRAPTNKRGAYHNKQSPGEFLVLFQ